MSPWITNVWKRLLGSRLWASGAVRGPEIRILSRTSLTPTHSVHIVEVDGQRMVLGCHPGGFLVLGNGEQKL